MKPLSPVIIAAVALNGAIGRSNALMWHLSADMKFFRNTTTGGCVIMGRKTFESIGRPLPGRQNIVISRGEPELPDGVELAHSLEEALSASNRDNTFIIGGAQIYAKAMSLADELLITRVFLCPDDADAFFPAIDADVWDITEQGETLEEEGIRFRFERYKKSLKTSN